MLAVPRSSCCWMNSATAARIARRACLRLSLKGNEVNGDHEQRITALEQARKELEVAFMVMTHLETKQSNVIKLQAEETEKLKAQEEKQRKLNAETDRRIADLVSAIGALIRKVPQQEGKR